MSATAARAAFQKLFSPSECAVRGCDRRPAKDSRFCPPHLEDRREHRVTVFHCGPDESLSMIGERNSGATGNIILDGAGDARVPAEGSARGSAPSGWRLHG